MTTVQFRCGCVSRSKKASKFHKSTQDCPVCSILKIDKYEYFPGWEVMEKLSEKFFQRCRLGEEELEKKPERVTTEMYEM